MTPREKREKYLAALQDDLDAIEERIKEARESHRAHKDWPQVWPQYDETERDIDELIGEARIALILRRQVDELQRANNTELERYRGLKNSFSNLEIENHALHAYYQEALERARALMNKGDDDGEAKTEEANEDQIG